MPPKSITGRANWPFQKRHVIKQEYKSVYCMSSVTLVDQYEKISKTYHLVSHYLSCPRNFLLNKIIKVHPTLYQKLAKFCPYTYSNDSTSKRVVYLTSMTWLWNISLISRTEEENNQARKTEDRSL